MALEGAMGWRILTAALAVLSLGCGASNNLHKLEDTFEVASGGVDPDLLGTFRLADPSGAAPGMLTLLVMRQDGSFHAERIDSCDVQPCTVAAVDGTFQQTRELPNPARGSGVVLASKLGGPDVVFRMELKRAAVADSPLAGLYHPASTDMNGRSVPSFPMTHPLELWCAVQADCTGQDPSARCAFTCASGRCVCAP